MEKLIIPENFFISSRAPRLNEIHALHDWLAEHAKHKIKVLEFGCGVTTLIINEAIKPKTYVALEQFKPCIESILKYEPNITILTGDWRDIPDYQYDLVMCDGSTGAFKGCPKLDPNEKRAFRDDALDFTKKLYSEDAWVILHDWNHNQKWQRPRRYLEKCGWNLLWSYTGRYGWGIYSKQTKEMAGL